MAVMDISDYERRLMRLFRDTIPVSNIYFGIRSFGVCGKGEMFLEVDDNCIRLSVDESAVEPLVEHIEKLPFEHIKKIMCGPVRHGSSQCFIAFCVTNNLSLNSAGVGPHCMLCPTMASSTLNSGKYILVLLDSKALEEFRKYMNERPYTGMMQNKCLWLHYEPRWPEASVKGCMFAHAHRHSYTFDELRDRAARELGTNEEARAAKRTRTESSAPSTASTATTTNAAATTATYSTPLLSSPPPLSSMQEYAVWQAKRDKDIVEIKNTLRDKELCKFLTQLQLERLGNRLTELLLQ